MAKRSEKTETVQRPAEIWQALSAESPRDDGAPPTAGKRHTPSAKFCAAGIVQIALAESRPPSTAILSTPSRELKQPDKETLWQEILNTQRALAAHKAAKGEHE